MHFVFDPAWNNHNGRLRIVFKDSFVPENIASQCSLIMETQMDIKEEIKRIANTKPNKLDKFRKVYDMAGFLIENKELPPFPTAENQTYVAS